MKLALALLAVSSLAFAQTPATPSAKPATATAHHAATKSAPASAIPHVAGVPKTLYALKYIDIKLGTGPLAQPQKFYTVHYTGWFTDGKKFDSSYDRGEPITFPYGAKRVITGWDTGFEGMHVGGKRRLFIPYQLAYGMLGNPAHGMPAKANLIFDVELIGISDTPPAPPARPTPPAPAAKPTGQEPQPAATPNPAATPDAKPATDPAAPKPPAQSSNQSTTPPPSH